MSEANPFLYVPKKRTTLVQRVVNLVQLLVIIGFGLIIVYQFIATPNQVNGRSMQPNFATGEVVLTNRLAKWLNNTEVAKFLNINLTRGDVVVVETPQLPSEKYIIKRLMGLPGDVMSVQNGKVLLNGKILNETDYLPANRITDPGSFLTEGDELQVQPGQFAILGDNRPESLDSRDARLGFIDQNKVIGKVVLRFWPFNKISIINTGVVTTI